MLDFFLLHGLYRIYSMQSQSFPSIMLASSFNFLLHKICPRELLVENRIKANTQFSFCSWRLNTTNWYYMHFETTKYDAHLISFNCVKLIDFFQKSQCSDGNSIVWTHKCSLIWHLLWHSVVHILFLNFWRRKNVYFLNLKVICSTIQVI